MERQIKFKVWDINKKVFIPTDVWAVTTSNFSYFAVMIKDWEDYKEGEYMYPVSQTLSQFTGLTDKNGKEIYEGDIMKHIYDDRLHHWLISFEDGGFVLKNIGIDGLLSNPFRLTQSDANNRIVIGNIYENKC